MTSELISTMLFRGRKQIECLPGRYTLEAAPAGKGESVHRPRRTGGPAKLSGIALVLDAIYNKKVSAIEGESRVFVRFVGSDGNTYECICSKNLSNVEICYLGNQPEKNRDNLIPLFLFETRTSGDNNELKDAFRALKSGANDEHIFMLCDSFYYKSAANHEHADIYENERSLAEVEAAIRAGILSNNHVALSEFNPPKLTIGAVDEFGKEMEKKEDKVVSADEEFERICLGEAAVDYPWSEDQKKRIPSIKTLEDFVPTAAFWKGSRKIKYRTGKILERIKDGLTGLDALGKDAVNFFMTGKPGTGKTTIAKALAAAYQIPFYSIPIQKGTEEGTFQGLLKARDGKFVFTSTDFLDAFKNGGVVVLEEINLADPAVLSGAIGQAIESPYYVMEDDISPVYRHPMCIIVGTFNVGTAGSKEINPMLSSRFYQTYVVDDPDEGEFVARLM